MLDALPWARYLQKARTSSRGRSEMAASFQQNSAKQNPYNSAAAGPGKVGKVNTMFV